MEALSYRLDDFLLFGPDAYWRLFGLANSLVWPLPLVLVLLALVVLVIGGLRPHPGPWLGGTFLAFAWAISSLAFLRPWYVPLNGLATHVDPWFWAEAVALASAGFMGRGSEPVSRRRQCSGSILLGIGLVVYPMLALVRGVSWRDGEYFGMAPEPTAIATLGFVILMGTRAALVCLPIPVLVCGWGALTLWALGSWQAWVPLLALAVALAGLVPHRPPAQP